MNDQDFADDAILSVNSPRERCGGPYMVIAKNKDTLWAMAALDFDGVPCIGIRWFNTPSGYPVSNGRPIWLILPEEVACPALAGLSADPRFLAIIFDYLQNSDGGLQGPELAVIGGLKSSLERCGCDPAFVASICHTCYRDIVQFPAGSADREKAIASCNEKREQTKAAAAGPDNEPCIKEIWNVE